MAEKILIKNAESGEVQYPVTHQACILTENGSRLVTFNELQEVIKRLEKLEQKS